MKSIQMHTIWQTVLIFPSIFAATTVPLALRKPLASLYVTDALAIESAMVRIKYNVTFYVIACTNSVLSHTIQAFGYSIISTVNSIMSVLVFRIFWMAFIYPPHRIIEAPIESLNWIIACWPVSWGLMMIVNIIIVPYLYKRRLKRGKLKEIT